MKFVAKKDRVEYKNGKLCMAYDYSTDDKEINGSLIEVTGRYPEQGRVVNTVCKELAYIIKGVGKIVVEGKKVVLQEGDEILIEPGEKYFWEDGNLTVFVSCTPAWYPEQHRQTE